MTAGQLLAAIAWLLVVPSFAHGVDYTFSGHLRGQGRFSWHDEDNILSRESDQQGFLDASVDLRLNGALFLTDSMSFEVAYEAVVSGGQTRESLTDISRVFGSGNFLEPAAVSDDRQFFSLSRVFTETDEYLGYHRIDRLFLALDAEYGTVKIGRQPLTWGNGLVFNPTDLINPFGPADIIRDYKVGADMILYQVGGKAFSDFQLVYVPRRDPEDGELHNSQTTVGTKLRLSASEKDVDLLLLSNYEDPVIGAGITGFLGGGVYRADWTLTFPEDDHDTSYYFSAVANFDYSWTLKDKNWYGAVELYYNGLGADTPKEALEDEALRTRLARGEIFVTGKYYFDGLVQYEMHPLVNGFVSVILNLEDFSFLLQPRITWECSQTSQLLIGLDLPVGRDGDEFGEPEDGDVNITVGRPLIGYMVFTWFF